MRFSFACSVLAALVASLAISRSVQAQVNASGTGSATGTGVPGVGIGFVREPPSLAFSMRLDGGVIVRGLPAAGAEFDATPDFGVVQGTATISLGSETKIGGFYTELGFGGGVIIEGDEAYSATLNAMYQRPWRWFRLGGGLGGSYHALGRGEGEGFDHAGEVFLRINMEIDPFMNKVWNPYFGLSGQAGIVFSDVRIGAGYAGAAAIGFRFSDW